jgi:cytochrome c oxidase subunit I
VYETSYGGAAQAETWASLTGLSVLGGVIVFVSAMLFVTVMVVTMLKGKPKAPERLEWADALGVPEGGFRSGIWDRLGLWWAVAFVLVLIAYAVPLAHILSMPRYGSPGFKPF